MAGLFLVSDGCIAAAAGVPLLWIAWRQPPARKTLPRVAGWLLILGAAVLLGVASGAWGLAVSATATSAAALLILAYGASNAAPAKRTLTRAAALRPLDMRRIFAELPRRIAVF